MRKVVHINQKSKGLKADPWGTPVFIDSVDESMPLKKTCWWRSFMYEINQSKSISVIPRVSNFFIKTLCFTVSRAFARSKNTTVTLPSSTSVSQLSTTFINAVCVDLFLRKPCWQSVGVTLLRRLTVLRRRRAKACCRRWIRLMNSGVIQGGVTRVQFYFLEWHY